MPSSKDAAACHKNVGGWTEVENRYMNVAQLDKYTVKLTLVLTRPRWIFKKEIAVVVHSGHESRIIFGSTLSLRCYR